MDRSQPAPAPRSTRPDADHLTPAVPVALAVRADRYERLSRLVEGALAWPVVAVDDPVLPPVAVLTDVATARQWASAGGALPSEDAVEGASPGRGPATDTGGATGLAVGAAHRTGASVVLLVGEDDPPQVAAAAGARAAAILPWPPSVAALRRAVLGGSARGPRAVHRAWCTVAGAAGGVGATAVALALAGIRAWRSGRTLAAVSGPPHVPDAPLVGGDDLASPAAWAAGAPVAGLTGLRVVNLRRADAPVVVGSVPTVVEVGATVRATLPAPDVLVVGRDRAGLAAIGDGPARAVVVVGGGPVDVGRIRRAAAPARVVVVGRDPRVAAACHAGRHPTDAPGSWLRPLADVVAALDGRGAAGAGPVDAA